MCNDGLIVFLLEEPLESEFDLCLYGNMAAELFRVSSFEQDIICIIIFICQCFYITPGHCLYSLCDLIDRISIYFPAEFDLCLHLITVCDCNISHIVSYSHDTHMAALDHAYSRAHPGADLLLYIFVSPVSDDHLALNAHTGEDMSILTAAVGRLVLVHEIHVDGIIWDFTVKLRVKVEKRFSVLLKTENP